MWNDYLVEARLAEIRQEAMRASVERAVRELYGDPRAKRTTVDPALFARYVWNGFHQ